MSKRDIWPFTNRNNSDAYGFSGASGSTKNTVNTSWKDGEVVTIATGSVVVSAAGTIDPSTGLIYLAKVPSEGAIVKAGGLAATSLAATSKPEPFYAYESGVEFVTRNAYSGSDTNIGPAGSGAMTGVTVGADCDLYRSVTGVIGGGVNGDFGIDVAGDWFTITRLLNSQGQDTSEFGGTVNWIVFARVGL
jgi:hypothetical protein